MDRWVECLVSPSISHSVNPLFSQLLNRFVGRFDGRSFNQSVTLYFITMLRNMSGSLYLGVTQNLDDKIIRKPVIVEVT